MRWTDGNTVAWFCIVAALVVAIATVAWPAPKPSRTKTTDGAFPPVLLVFVLLLASAIVLLEVTRLGIVV